MNEHSLSKVPPGLKEKLERVTSVRALMVTLLLASAVALNIGDLDSFFEPTYVAITIVITATYLATLVYSLLIRLPVDLRRMALAQCIGDSLLSGALIALTGGPESAFLFLFFLSIITAAYLLGRTGALFSASACSVVYALILLATGGYLSLRSPFDLILPAESDVAAYTVSVNVLALYAVALLAGHLAERLGQVDTELEQRWTDIRQLRVLNQNIVSSVAGGLCTLDLADRVISFNAAAERITGLSSAQTLGRYCAEVLPSLFEALCRFREDGADLEQPITGVSLTRSDGQRLFLDVSVAELHEASNQRDGYILYFSDVTEVRRLQEAIQRQKRMAAVGQLSASIAHEIRNPLASISGSVQMLRGSEEIGHSERRLMDIVVREIDRLNHLLEQFLAYARPHRLEKEPLDVDAVVEESVLLFKQDASLSGSVDFRIERGRQPLRIEGDANALKQIFLNLFRNAAEAMSGAGTIHLHLALHPSKRGADRVEIAVTDEGPGLSPDAKTRLFEPFFTTKKGGTGLGLATAHRLVEALGGMIWADDVESRTGARFTITFPALPHAPGAEESTRHARIGPRPARLEPAGTRDPKPVET